MTEEGRPRGRYPKGAERREQIVRTATDVFATAGFEGTALKRVAELVGIREATLFHYFRGKQELLTAVLTERDRRSLEAMNATEPGLSLMARSAARNLAEPGLTALYVVASATAHDPQHASHEYFRERYATGVLALRKEIEQQQVAGEVRADVPADVLARLVVAISDGLQLQWLYDKNVDYPAELSLFIEVLMKPSA